MAGLNCPKCGCEKSYVKDCRTVADGLRRRRECQQCGSRWTTYELDNALMRRVIKKGFQVGIQRRKDRRTKTC